MDIPSHPTFNHALSRGSSIPSLRYDIAYDRQAHTFTLINAPEPIL